MFQNQNLDAITEKLKQISEVKDEDCKEVVFITLKGSSAKALRMILTLVDTGKEMNLIQDLVEGAVFRHAELLAFELFKKGRGGIL